MTSLNRTVRCSNCSTDANLSLSSDMDLKELTFAGRCSRCGATMQINFNIIGGPQAGGMQQAAGNIQQSHESSIFSSPASDQPCGQSGEVNLDESIFGSASSASDSSSVSSDSSSSSDASSSSSDSSEPSSPFLDSDSSGATSEEIENVSDALKDLMEA